jgi:DNA-binding transcriptional ArsR family regulator
MTPPDHLARLLRAAADPTRLRLLRLCADRATTVSDLAAALADSEPNISRHLKALAGVGLVQRSRRGQWVEYSATEGTGSAADLLHWLLAQLEPQDPALLQARTALNRPSPRLAAGVDRLAAPVAMGSRFGRALRAVIAEDAPASPHGRALLLHAANPEPLQWLAQRASETWALAGSVAERATLRRKLAPSGLRIEIALRPGLVAAASSGRFAEALVDLSGAEPDVAAALRSLLELASALLAPAAPVWLVADYDALERTAEPGISPPRALRLLAQQSGFDCDSLRPVDADGRHVLVARCRRSPAGAALARTA